MRTVASVVILIMLVMGAWAQDYDREVKERPLGATVVVDEANNVVNILIHSIPTPRPFVEGIKNPIKSVRVLSVAVEKIPYITAILKTEGYTVEVRASSKFDESNEDMRLRLQNSPFKIPDQDKVDLSSAEYRFDRVLIISVVLTRYRGYDDEQMYDDQGKLRNWYIEERKVRVLLPGHACRLHWTPKGQTVESFSPWMNAGSDFDDLRWLVQRSLVRPQVEIREIKVPNDMTIYSASGALWTGKLVDSGQAIGSLVAAVR